MISKEIETTLNRVKGSGNSKHASLPSVIGKDLIRFGKLPLCLLVCIIITAMMVLNFTHYTRLLIAKREQKILEHDALDIEWRNLILEENALGAHSRIERIATEKLQLQHIDPSQERIVVQTESGKG